MVCLICGWSAHAKEKMFAEASWQSDQTLVCCPMRDKSSEGAGGHTWLQLWGLMPYVGLVAGCSTVGSWFQFDGLRCEDGPYLQLMTDRQVKLVEKCGVSQPIDDVATSYVLRDEVMTVGLSFVRAAFQFLEEELFPFIGSCDVG